MSVNVLVTDRASGIVVPPRARGGLCTASGFELDDEPMRPLADHAPQQEGESVADRCVRLYPSAIVARGDDAPVVGGIAVGTAGTVNSGDGGANIGTDSEPAGTSSLKWRILPLLCFFLFGTDYCFDLPGSIGAGEGITIQTHFASQGLTYNQKMNQSLYSIYSYPNMLMTIAGGLLIDKYLGLRSTALLMAGTVVVSSFVFSLGIYLASYPCIVLGRFLFGLSGETLFVAQSAFLSRWFGKSPYMSLVFGVAVSFSRLGGGSSYMISPVIAEYGGVVAAALVGTFFATVSFVMCFVVCAVDKRCEAQGLVGVSAATQHKSQQKRRRLARQARASQQSSPSGSPNVMVDVGGADTINTSSKGFPTACALTMTAESSSSNSGESSFPASPTGSVALPLEEEASISFQLSFIPSLPKTLWLLAVSAMLAYGATFPFIGIAKTYFERVYAYDSSSASFSAGLFHMYSAVLCPLMGAGIDRVGRSPLWLMVAMGGLISVLSAFLASPGIGDPSVMVGFMSVFYALFVASLWSFAPHTVPSSASGFGFGVMSAAVNFGLASSPLVTGSILDAFTATAKSDGSDNAEILPSSEGFYYAILFLLGVLVCGFINAFMLWQVDAGRCCAGGAIGGDDAAAGDDSTAPFVHQPILMADPSVRAARKKARDGALEAQWARIIKAKHDAEMQ